MVYIFKKELARKIALKKQEKIDAAEETLKKAKKNADNELPSEYLIDNSVEGTRMASKIVTPGEELEAAIKEYEKFSDLMSNTDTNNQNLYEIYESHRDDASARIKEMYGLISPTIDAYESLIDAGIQLEGEDKTLYEQLKTKKIKKLLLIATGALTNATSTQQGESIPGIAHAVSIEI